MAVGPTSLIQEIVGFPHLAEAQPTRPDRTLVAKYARIAFRSTVFSLLSGNVFRIIPRAILMCFNPT